MSTDLWGKALFSVLVLIAIAVLVLVARGVQPPRTTKRVAVGAAAALLVVAGIGLTLAPFTASTGATCLISPTTYVLGPAGAAARVDEAPEGTDRASTRSCIDNARSRTGIAVLLVLAGSGACAIQQRMRRVRGTTSV